jgi:geranylgeranyl reductase family protein
MIETDVLIIGAGPAGSAAALFLAKQGIASVIVDKEKFPRDKICGDALSGKVVEVLKKLDSQLISDLKVDKSFLGSWGVNFIAPSGEVLRIPFRTKKEQLAAPGFISRRMDFDNWLIDKIKSNSAIQLYEETEIRNYQREGNVIVAESEKGKIFKAKVVIACDGAYSSFAKDMAGIRTEAAHNCFGLRAYYKGVKGLDTQNFIELHFLKEVLPGYFWIFPLPDGYANVGIGMRSDKMHRKGVNLKRSLQTILENTEVIRERFATAERIGDIKQFGLPLGSKKRELSGDNYMLCGDAAQLIDPFTGEGIGNAMLSGIFAARQVERCLAEKNFTGAFMKQYDEELYKRLWSELLLSYRLQQLVNFPSLFNFIVRKGNSNAMLSDTISCMFEDLDMRARLKSPMFYFNLLFSQPRKKIS